MAEFRHVGCPSCGRVRSVDNLVTRPICLHTWDTEVWDADNCGMDEGDAIEDSPNEEYRKPGKWWEYMVPVIVSFGV